MAYTTRFAFILSFLAFCNSQNDRVQRVGNEIRMPSAGQNVDFSGHIILINNLVLQPGLLFGFSAYFTSTDDVYFQVWRSNSQTSGSFRLIQQWAWAPNVVDAREDVYIHLQGDECAMVQSGDLLGIYAPEINPIGYNFDNTGANIYRYLPATAPAENDDVTFTSLQLPYEFSVAAWIDTDGSGGSSCPQTLAIPDEGVIEDNSNPSSVGTGIFGSTGSTGATGPRGAPGARGPSATGEMGATGPMGSFGVSGHTGSTGPHGIAGVPGQDGIPGPPGPAGTDGINAQPLESTDKDEDDCTGMCATLTDPYLILALLIWLAVLSVIFIIYVIVTCCRTRDPYKAHSRASQSDLWKKYENVTYDKNGKDNTYAEVEEGKTVF